VFKAAVVTGCDPGTYHLGDPMKNTVSNVELVCSVTVGIEYGPVFVMGWNS